MNDYSYILKLDSINFPGVKYIRRIPGIENIKSKSGTFYGINYFVNNGKGIFKFRFTSLSPSFKTLHSMDFCNRKYEIVCGIEFDMDKITPDKFLDDLKVAFHTAVINKKSKSVSESFSNYLLKNNLLKEVDIEGAIQKIMRLSSYLQVFLGILTTIIVLIPVFQYYIRKYKNWKDEKESFKAETEINNYLFYNQTGKESAFSIYNNSIRYLEYLIHGNSKSLILCGPPGMSKTYIVRRTLHFSNMIPGKEYVIVKGGSLGIGELYELFYVNRNKLVILDDFDKPLKDEEMINMLKSITDSYSKRILSLPRETKVSSGQGGTIDSNTPQRFEFLGKLLIITNIRKKNIDKAILSRTPAIEIDFNTEEIIKNIEKMMVYINPDIPMNIKKEVYDYIIQLHKKYPNIKLDFRGFKSAVEVRYAIPEAWKDMVHIIVGLK